MTIFLFRGSEQLRTPQDSAEEQAGHAKRGVLAHTAAESIGRSEECRRASCTSHQGAYRSQMRDVGSTQDSLDLLAIVCAQHAQAPSMPIIVVAPCPLRMHERDDADEQPIQHSEESAMRSAWLPPPLRTEANLARIRNRARRGRVLPPTPSATASGLLADDGGWLIADVDVATGHIEWRSTTSID